MDSGGKEVVGRREEGEWLDAAWVCGATESAELRGSVWAQGGGNRRVSDVQRAGPIGRDGDRRQGADAERADRRAGTELEQVRFLLFALQIHRQYGRGWEFRRQGDEDRGVRRRFAAGDSAEAESADHYGRSHHAQLLEGA